MNDHTPSRLISVAHAVLWLQAALLVGAGVTMVAFGSAASGDEARVGIAMMFLAIYPLLLSVAAVALAAALRVRRPGTRGWAIGFEVFLLLVTGPFVNYPYVAVAVLGACAVMTSAFVIAVMVRPASAAHFSGRARNALRGAAG
jgi:hypothetical protein